MIGRCASMANLMDLYVEGRLSPSSMKKAAAHIKDCSRCRKLYEEQRPLKGPALGAPAGLKARLKAAAASPRSEPLSAGRPGIPAAAIRSLAAALLCAAVLMLVNWFGPGETTQAPPSTVPMVRLVP